MHFYDEKLPRRAGRLHARAFHRRRTYQALQKRLGLERVVVVQPNAYADDNSRDAGLR